jgi:hypothetical protein
VAHSARWRDGLSWALAFRRLLGLGAQPARYDRLGLYATEVAGGKDKAGDKSVT